MDGTLLTPSRTSFGIQDSLIDCVSRAVTAVVVCRYPWAWLVTQKELVRSALSGMCLSFAMAFLVLNIATGNLITAILSTLTVAGVMSMSLGIGIVGIMGWPLGISESISVVILIGFSMDYVLHIAGTKPRHCLAWHLVSHIRASAALG